MDGKRMEGKKETSPGTTARQMFRGHVFPPLQAWGGGAEALVTVTRDEGGGGMFESLVVI